jgi:Dyp-type peroxidase family
MSIAEALEQPISGASNDHDILAFLNDLQGNILKGHGREHTANVFCKFPAGKVAATKAFLDRLVTGNLVKSANAQLEDTRAYNHAKEAGEPLPESQTFYAVMISAAGYAYLGVPAANRPDDVAFSAGMQGRQAQIKDLPTTKWDADLKGTIHAMILIADTSADKVATKLDKMMQLLDTVGIKAGGKYSVEHGKAIFNEAGEGLEHFGYVDGRSQPLVLIEDIHKEMNKMGGIDQWSPVFPPDQFVVPDKGGANGAAYGSYFVFRKLEERVRAFKQAEAALGTSIGVGEMAGALVIGRYEDGTPIQISPLATHAKPVFNNFDYAGEPDNISGASGPRCPIHSHIRKSNPRTDDTRGATMARRGITYGNRTTDTHVDENGRVIMDEVEPDERPVDGIGLLFMSYQASIKDQFEVIQGGWVNDSNYPAAGTGVDPVLSTVSDGVKQRWPEKKWGAAPTKDIDYFKANPGSAAKEGPYVVLKGGEYFFAPSLSALTSF